MRKQVAFRYFPEYEKWAQFADENCHCSDDSPCLEAIYFENPDLEDPVCLDELIDGRVRVEIPDYLQKQLMESIRRKHSNWDDQQVNSAAAQFVDTLSKTPPVPWIQHNVWPVCCGDFCCYLGEWSQEKLIEASPDGDGSAFLWSILADSYRARRDDPQSLWQEIENGWTEIFVFRCFDCNKLIAGDQSY